MIEFTTVSSPEDVQQILALQKQNLPGAISPEELASQGFVTVNHDPAVLQRMNKAYPSVIAKAPDGRLAGYCLVMLREFAPYIPELTSMFAQLETLEWRGRSLKDQVRWFVMGQVCVAKEFRGLGVFDGMYRHLQAVCGKDFEVVITEVSERNTRSLRTHQRVGFQTIYAFKDETTGEPWQVVALPL